jgi:hypothetical protein
MASPLIRGNDGRKRWATWSMKTTVPPSRYRLVLAVTKVIDHLGFQRLLNQQLRELLEQPVLTNQVFRLSIISQQAIQQLLGYGSLRYGHHRSWQWGSFLPIDRLHKNSYTLHYGLMTDRRLRRSQNAEVDR